MIAVNRVRAKTAEEQRATSHVDAWVRLWRSAPAEVVEDVIYLAAVTPMLALVWAALWIAGPK